MFNSGLLKQLGETLASVAALNVRTEDVAKGLKAIEQQFVSMSERITRLEERYALMRESVVAEVRVELARLEMENQILRGSLQGEAKAEPRRGKLSTLTVRNVAG